MSSESSSRVSLEGLVRYALIVLLVIFAVNVAVILHIRGATQDQIYSSPDAVPPGKVAIVFGASVHQRTLSDVLQDRVLTGIELYRKGKVRKLLMSGDNRFVSYNEPIAMKRYAVVNGIPERDIVLDFAGRNTYDTCYRAKAIFGVDSAILVTQSYHLPRALYLAQAMGIRAVGVRADRRAYRGQFYYSLREQLALLHSWFKMNVSKPVPILGDPLPIDMDSQSRSRIGERDSSALSRSYGDAHSSISRRSRHHDRF